MENVKSEMAVEIGWVESVQTIDECVEEMGKFEYDILESICNWQSFLQMVLHAKGLTVWSDV